MKKALLFLLFIMVNICSIPVAALTINKPGTIIPDDEDDESHKGGHRSFCPSLNCAFSDETGISIESLSNDQIIGFECYGFNGELMGYFTDESELMQIVFVDPNIDYIIVIANEYSIYVDWN